MSPHGPKPADQRPRTGQEAVMPRTLSKPENKLGASARVHRVNQTKVDRMIELRRQGFSHTEIGERVGCSERTVRRHTKAVSPQLVHAGDPKRVDFVTWCSQRAFAVKDRLELSVPEIDVAIKLARQAVLKLDELTVQRLELDPKMRMDFWLHVVWPAAAREIRSVRWIERIEAEFGPLQKDDDSDEAPD